MTGRILTALRGASEGLTLPGLVRALSLDREDRPELRALLRDLEQEGAVIKTGRRYFFPSGTRVVRGRMVTVGRGFAFIRLKDGGGDVFVPGRGAGTARRGDLVELLLSRSPSRGRPEGRVVRVIERRHQSLLGVVKERGGGLSLRPYDTPSMEDLPFSLPPGRRIPLGAIVEVDRDSLRLNRVLGVPDDPGVDLQVIARRYDLSPEFTPEAEAEAEDVAGRPLPERESKRRDFREWLTVTIDEPEARDFDDAVSIRRMPGGGWRLAVHIADVAHYIPEGSSLDREACRKGTSVYFPECAYPMLPDVLSGDICSLRPGEDRPAVSVLMNMDAEGRIRKAGLTPSLIRSDERLTYDEVLPLFREGPGGLPERTRWMPDLLEMRKLAGLMRERRLAKGGLDLQKPEPRLVMEGGKITAVETRVPHEVHGLIEEFMIAANQAVAEFLSARGATFLYRVHPAPSPAGLDRLRIRLSDFGIPLPLPDKVDIRDLRAVLVRAERSPASSYLSRLLLRSLKPAYYSVENPGHFGLGMTAYTHFTSPIRRYPDLIGHRILKALLGGKPASSIPDMTKIARHCSERERLAESAERDLMEWRILRFLKTRLGDVLEGFVVEPVRAGLIVELPDYFVSGLIPEEDRPEWTGRPGGPDFSPGVPVRVTLAAVDSDMRRITLVPASGEEG